jgi:iron-sulfur cluster repair protein YtfE (RIC family)
MEVTVRITDALLGEHGALYPLLDHLESVAANPALAAELSTRAAVLAAALEGHARLEEELLFSALAASLGSTGPLHVMRMEHNEIDRILMELQQAPGPATARELTRNLIAVTRAHFGKEEQVLFPMALGVLANHVSEQLGRQWAERRQVHLVGTAGG